MGFKYHDVRNQVPGYTQLSGTVTTGALGASTTLAINGVVSWTRISVGRFQIVLDNDYVSLLNVQMAAEDTAEQGFRFQIHSEAVTTALAGTIDLQFYDYNSPGNLIDPAGTILHLTIELQANDIG